MKNNLFEDLQAKKERLRQLASKAVEYGWIDSPKKEGFINKLDKEVLTIGVIGQMKCGKSTFLNSFVFEEDILPAATTPMTAALSVITYGAKKEVVAEFYTKDEWEEQKMQAMRSLDEVAGNPLEESKVKAAKELVKSSSKLGDSLNSHLGKTKVDSLDNLKEYVGADGKYVSITKSVTIHYPKEYLKNVEIVDTPGFNDPVVSREERTKSFLRKADVVLLMLYAGRPFDATDREILFKHVAQCGMGKVLIGINKYDIPYENGESEEQIKEYVREQLSRAIDTYHDNSLSEIIETSELMTLSAEMALLSVLPMNKIISNEAYKYAWQRNCDNFEISTQLQMRDKSHIDALVAKIKQMIDNEKDRILYKKLNSAILAIGNEKKQQIEKQKQECLLLINTLNQPDSEIDKRKKDIERAGKRLCRKIDCLESNILSELQRLAKKGEEELDKEIDDACMKMEAIIGRFEKSKQETEVRRKIEWETDRLATRTLKYKVNNLSEDINNEILSKFQDFIIDVEGIFIKYLPDFEIQDFIVAVKGEVMHKYICRCAFRQQDLENQEDLEEDDDDSFLWGLLAIPLLPFILIGSMGIGDCKRKLYEHVDKIRGVDTKKFVKKAYERKDEVVQYVQHKFIDEVIRPLENELNEIIKCKSKREEKLANLKSKHESILKDEKKLKEELEAISALL